MSCYQIRRAEEMKRSTYISFRVSEEEMAAINGYAKRLERTRSDAIRTTLLKSAAALEDLGHNDKEAVKLEVTL
jgi:hypothetical protein